MEANPWVEVQEAGPISVLPVEVPKFYRMLNYGKYALFGGKPAEPGAKPAEPGPVSAFERLKSANPLPPPPPPGGE